MKRVGKEYRLRDFKSLAVGDRGWYWHSKNEGGWSALSFLTKVRGYGLVDAVCLLLGELPQERMNIENTATNKTTNPLIKDSDRQPISLPLHNKDNKRIIAYLQSRGIDKDIIMDCINRGILYESRYQHNCVFLGKDETGKTRYAALRSITSNYMRDADGSNKKYGFILPPANPVSNTVAVYESPIDALSSYTLCKSGYVQEFNGWRLSLGGTSTLALEHFLNQHPKVNYCIISTDNDEAGNIAAEKIMAMPSITTERSIPIEGCKDWNDMLQMMKRDNHIINNSRKRGLLTL